MRATPIEVWLFYLCFAPAVVTVPTSAWVLLETSRREARRFRGGGPKGPISWFVACLLFWPVAFPAYLVTRHRPHEAHLTLARTDPYYGSRWTGWDTPKSQPGVPLPADVATLVSARLAGLRASAQLSNDEYERLKRTLLG